jgi:hypothetical protein
MNTNQLIRMLMMFFRRGGKKNKWVVGLFVLLVGYNFAAPKLNQKFGLSLPALNGNQTQHQSTQHQPSDAHQPLATPDGTPAAGYSLGPKWSNTRPAINLHHVFQGEINRKGAAVGFHSRPGGRDPDTARLVRLRDRPNRAGVYTAVIEVRDGSQWREKFSSFFPDNMSPDQVTAAILAAFKNSDKAQPWRGPSGLGFDIQGYTLSKGDINTAFPVYQGDR